MRAYVKFGKWGNPYLTESADEVLDKPLWFHELGLSETASGYGSNLRTPYMIRFRGRLYRVYCVCWSNSGTLFIRYKNEKVVVDLERV